MYTFIAAAAVLVAVTGGVVAVIRRIRGQAVLNARLRTFCAR